MGIFDNLFGEKRYKDKSADAKYVLNQINATIEELEFATNSYDVFEKQMQSELNETEFNAWLESIQPTEKNTVTVIEKVMKFLKYALNGDESFLESDTQNQMNVSSIYNQELNQKRQNMDSKELPTKSILSQTPVTDMSQVEQILTSNTKVEDRAVEGNQQLTHISQLADRIRELVGQYAKIEAYSKDVLAPKDFANFEQTIEKYETKTMKKIAKFVKLFENQPEVKEEQTNISLTTAQGHDNSIQQLTKDASEQKQKQEEQRSFVDLKVDVVQNEINSVYDALREVGETGSKFREEYDASIEIMQEALEKVSVETLMKLAENGINMIRISVAKNQNTPVETLAKLAKDTEHDVRLAVAENQNTPVETLVELSKKPSFLIQSAVAEHSNTPVEILVELSKNDSERVKLFVASNQNTPVDTLAELALYPDGDIVQLAVARNANTSTETLEKLMMHEDKGIRYYAANNPNIQLCEVRNSDTHKIMEKSLQVQEPSFAGIFLAPLDEFFSDKEQANVPMPEEPYYDQNQDLMAFCNTDMGKVQVEEMER